MVGDQNCISLEYFIINDGLLREIMVIIESYNFFFDQITICLQMHVSLASISYIKYKLNFLTYVIVSSVLFLEECKFICSGVWAQTSAGYRSHCCSDDYYCSGLSNRGRFLLFNI